MPGLYFHFVHFLLVLLFLLIVQRKRCDDASHSESTSCKIHGTLVLGFAKLWEYARVLASLFFDREHESDLLEAKL